MATFDAYASIVKRQVPLAPFTHLKLGGPAEYLIHPESREELIGILKECSASKMPVRILGSGCNLLVRDEGIAGAVIRLTHPSFAVIQVMGAEVTAGAGATVSNLISEAVRHGLGGLETLVGIKGTVGGALRCNAGDRGGDIGQYVRRVEVLDMKGTVQIRERDELKFGPHKSNLDDPVLLSATFTLEKEDPSILVKRMRRAWIHRKAHQPMSFQAATRIFQDPSGFTAAGLIEQAGLGRTQVGGAEISDRDPNAIVVNPGASSRDVLRLIELIKSKVQERFGQVLTLEITIW